MEKLPTSLQEALIPAFPASGYYVPNFIDSEEEAHLLREVSLRLIYQPSKTLQVVLETCDPLAERVSYVLEGKVFTVDALLGSD